MRNGTSLAGEVAGPSMRDTRDEPARYRFVGTGSAAAKFAQFFYQADKKEKCLNSPLEFLKTWSG
jgi:hypothetical protein